MKKYFACLLASAFLLMIASCGAVEYCGVPTTSEPTTDVCDGGCTTTWNETYPTTCNGGCTTTAPSWEMTSSRDDIAPLDPEVHLYDADGRELELYSELVWFMDGMLIGDGALIMMSVSSRLPAIAERIPLVDLGGTPEVRLSAREGVTIHFKNTVNVYGEDYALLAENVPLDALREKGSAEWQGRTVYVYFTATFSDDTPDYDKSTCNGYFVKTSFS